MGIWMSVLWALEEASATCKHGCTTCSKWDEAVAYYTGSIVGPDSNSLINGRFLYSLANELCKEFRTCGSRSRDLIGNSYVNIRVFQFFTEGQGELYAKLCDEAMLTKRAITSIMAVPLIQGTLRLAYDIGVRGIRTIESNGEGAAFAASILPLIHDCNSHDAWILYLNMRVASLGLDYAAVRAALEKNYHCLKISCGEVGGYYDVENEMYFVGAEPCQDRRLSRGAIAAIVIVTFTVLMICICLCCCTSQPSNVGLHEEGVELPKVNGEGEGDGIVLEDVATDISAREIT
mmetsp:Transcript_28301/g.65583  ORF Transcript_28301/g.65583 Transcript_28301/m.65583 type:complete len:291 (-) Transcript_28301:502-1374(-)